MSLTPDDQFIRVQENPFQVIDGRALVLTPNQSRAHELNESATDIYELLDQKRTLTQLLSELSCIYGSEVIINNQSLIIESLDSMIAKDLVRRI